MSKKNNQPSNGRDFSKSDRNKNDFNKEPNAPAWDPQDYPLRLDNPAQPIPGLAPSRSYIRKVDDKKQKDKTEGDASADT